MPDSRAKFTTLALPDNTVPEGRLVLTTRRGKQFNSIVIKDIDHLQGAGNRDDLFIHPHDMDRLGLKEGQRVLVKSDHGEWLARACPMNIKPGVVQAYWPECNGVISRRWDPRSFEPDYNAIVTITPA